MTDITEEYRRDLQGKINSEALSRVDLEQKYGCSVLDTEELQRDFKVMGFLAPFVVVERKSDGVKGAMLFQHSPRFYFDFVAEPEEGK
jgi:hypothetical protein